MPKKKRALGREKDLPVVVDWKVPMTYEYRGTVTVKARTEEEAYRAAKGGDFENRGDGEELINWEVIGKPQVS